MGYLTVFSTASLVMHGGCYLEYDGGMPSEWLSWYLDAATALHTGPITWGGLGGKGFINTNPYTDTILNYVRFSIDDSTLSSGRNNTITTYLPLPYQLGVNDCVSFARDLASACGLNVPTPAFLASNLVLFLNGANSPTNFGLGLDHPLPWELGFGDDGASASSSTPDDGSTDGSDPAPT
jgi:hypothetical protein